MVCEVVHFLGRIEGLQNNRLLFWTFHQPPLETIFQPCDGARLLLNATSIHAGPLEEYTYGNTKIFD